MGKTSEQVTGALDTLVDSFDFGKNTGCALFLTIILVVALLSAQPLIMFVELRNNIHVEFWLGPVPIWLNLAVPISLCEMFLIIICLNCRQSHICIKGTLLCWFTMNGVVLIGYGIYVLAHARMVADELISDCGGGPFSAKIQAEWDRLHAFHEQCKQQNSKDIFVQQCPDFASMEVVPHDLYVAYIEEMESDYNCQGFCQDGEEPLFNTEAGKGERCSKVVGEYLKDIGWEVGIPMMLIGTVAIGLGICLQHYKHL